MASNIYRGSNIFSNLRVGSFNCQGIIGKIEDPNFLTNISKYDIFGVCETWLHRENEKLNIPNYKFYPLSRKCEKDQSRGGVGWFVKEKLKKHIKSLYNISTENIFFCKIDKNYFNFDDDVYIGMIYFPPENSSREKRIKVDHFKKLLEKVYQITSNNTVLIGDFNARTKDLDDVIYDEEDIDIIPDLTSSQIKYKRNNADNKVNKYGRKLVDYCIQTKSYIANGRTLGDFQGKFTCYAYNGTSTVDYAVISETMHRHVSKFTISTPEFKSDHCMLTLVIELPQKIILESERTHNHIPPLKWDEKNKDIFKNHMKAPCTLKQIIEIDSCFADNDVSNDEILKRINFLYTYNTPKQKTKQKSKKPNKKWYDLSCYELNRKIKSLAKLNAKKPENHEIRKNLNMVKKQYKKLLKQKKRTWEDNIIKKLEQLESEDPKHYWKIIKEMRNTTENNNIYNITDFEKFYKSLFSEYNHKENSYQMQINKIVDDVLKDSKNIGIEPDFTLKEFNGALTKLRNNKTAGPDRIPAEMIKNSPENVLILILKLMNKIKNKNQYPNLWALGYTTLIHKTGDDEDPDNYRAITICSAMAKLFALMVKNRLDTIVEKSNLIGDCQIGFKKGARPADHLFLLKGIIDNYMQDGKRVYACFIDYHKAYDNIWREGVYYKLLKSGINPNMVNIIRSMYTNTKQGLKINRSIITNPFLSHRGLRQGCVLSPLLFNIFIDDLPRIFDESCRPVSLNDSKISCLMYADDIVLLSETEEGLRKSLNQLLVYSDNWCLKVNHKKTKTMIFQKRTRKQLKIIFDKHVLEEVKQFKYLGNILTNNGDFKQNDKYLRLKGLRASYQIMNILGRNLKPSKTIQLFEKVVEPILLYNCEITVAFMPKKWTYECFIDNMWNMKLEINRVVHNFIKQILGVGKKTSTNGILAECGKYPLCMKIYILIIRYWIRLRTSKNKYMQDLYKSEKQKKAMGKDSWLKMVDFLIKYTNCTTNNIEMENDKKIDIKIDFENKIKEMHKKNWNENIKKSFSESKMEFLCEYKRNFKFEDYIDNLNFDNRRIVAKFRLSNHKLPVEVLRYEKIKKEERLCPICDLKEIGNENHYILSCTNKAIQDVRDKFLYNAIKVAPELKQLNNYNIIKYCMHMGDPKLHYITARFIDDLLTTFNIENVKGANDKYLEVFMM